MAATLDERRSRLTLLAGTWNVGAEAPPSAETLRDWLGISPTRCADVYAIGLQEVVDINSPLAYMDVVTPVLSMVRDGEVNGLDDASPAQVSRWLAAIAAVLPTHMLVARKALVGMVTFVFVVEQHARFCSARVVALGTGPLGAGNKGAVGCSLHVYGSTLCILNSHLTAGKKEPTTRNKEVAQLLGGVLFPDPFAPDRPLGSPLPPRTIGAHEFVVWLGDLNYRIDMPDSSVRAQLERMDESLEVLASHDELLLEQAAGRVFSGFLEGTLAFRPTYKYDKRSDEYDTSAKRRAPAWCDRILWRQSEHMRGLTYQRHETTLSDHRPVSAELEMSVVSSSHLDGGLLPHAGSMARSTGLDMCGCIAACLKAMSNMGVQQGYREVPS